MRLTNLYLLVHLLCETITIQRRLSALVQIWLHSSGRLRFPRLRQSGDVLCRPVWWSNRWSMQHRWRCDCNSHGKPQQWQVLRRLFYPMAQCWLHEHLAAPKLRHYVLHHPVGVLQGCFWRTDKQGMRYGTSKPSNSEAIGCTEDHSTYY